ncbi:MAG: S-layer homology domain-containing protein [Eubacteriales bacterium]
MFLKRIVLWFTAFTVILSVLAPQALAAVIPSSVTVYINGDANPDPSIITRQNAVTVRVYDPGVAHVVKVGSIVATEYGVGDYEVDNYVLKPGLNSVTVSMDVYKNSYKITYIDEALPGASCYLANIPSSGTITAINKTLNLKFPKNNYVIDAYSGGGPEINDDQGILIRVLELDDYNAYHQPVSPVYSVTPADSGLGGDAEVLYPGALTLKYDANVSGSAADTLTVLFIPFYLSDYYNEESDFNDTWDDSPRYRDCLVLGGKVNPTAKTITVPFTKSGFGTYAVFNVSREFIDLAVGTDFLWARNYILPLWAKGVMEKMGSSENFGADSYITREEFTTALVNGSGTPVVTGLISPFDDIPGDLALWNGIYKDHILTAAKNGIIYGFPTTGGNYEFRPADLLTREQAATILARLANLKVSNDEETTKTAIGKAFTDDIAEFSPWSTPYIYAAYKAGFIKGFPSENGKTFTFNPKGYLTRSEAAKLIYVLMKYQKKL